MKNRYSPTTTRVRSLMSTSTIPQPIAHRQRVSSAWDAALGMARGQLPPRYLEPWSAQFDACIQPLLFPGVRILDAGAGRKPTIPPELRPRDCYYVGVDIS